MAYLLSGVLSDYVFEPFMQGNSSLAVTIGKVIGRGEGRGVALLILAVGILMMIIAVWANYEKSIREME